MAEDGHLVRIILSLRGGEWYCGDGPQEGYFFRKNKSKETAIHMICTKSWCPVTAAVDLDAEGHRIALRIINQQRHNHEPEPNAPKIIALKRKLLSRSGKERGDLKRIHLEEIIKAGISTIGKCSFSIVRAGMMKRRQRAQPPIPSTFPEMARYISRRMPSWGRTIEGGPFLFSHQDDGILFVSPITKLLLSDRNITFTADGVFKVAPRKPKVYQLYTLGAIYNNVFIPIGFGLLNSKRTEIYKWMFEELRKLVEHEEWRPSAFMMDYENGAMAAIKELFPEATITGCWFHYTQAIQRKCGKLGLIPSMEQNPDLRGCVKMLMALPLLPAQFIPLGMLHVKVEMQEFAEDPNIQTLIDYMETFWMKQIGPNIISVAGREIRTNNCQEAFHGTIMLYCGASRRAAHPNIWRFVEALQKIEHDFAGKMLEAASGTDLRCPRHRNWERQDERIDNAYRNLMDLPADNHPDFKRLRLDNIIRFLEEARHFVNVAGDEQTVNVNIQNGEQNLNVNIQNGEQNVNVNIQNRQQDVNENIQNGNVLYEEVIIWGEELDGDEQNVNGNTQDGNALNHKGVTWGEALDDESDDNRDSSSDDEPNNEPNDESNDEIEDESDNTPILIEDDESDDEPILIDEEPILIEDDEEGNEPDEQLNEEQNNELILIDEEPILIDEEPILIDEEPILIDEEPILIEDDDEEGNEPDERLDKEQNNEPILMAYNESDDEPILIEN